MAWNRQAPPVGVAPSPIALGRWFVAGAAALCAGVVLLVIGGSGQIPELSRLDGWALCGLPIAAWGLAFAARARGYGSALHRFQFIEFEAQQASEAWQAWGSRHMAVHASCVVLPDNFCASSLAPVFGSHPPRTGQPRRIEALPAAGDRRGAAALELLLEAIKPHLLGLGDSHELKVRLLTDAVSGGQESLREVWGHQWPRITGRPTPELQLLDELSFDWLDLQIRSGSTCLELILVVQVNGKESYSDGLAVMLLSPEQQAVASRLPTQARLLRPMPLDPELPDTELAIFFQAQAAALQATELFADSAHWQPLAGQVVGHARACGAQFDASNSWNLEALCGTPGPFRGWLLAALAVDRVRQQKRPVLALASEHSRGWISTVAAGARV